MKPHRERRRHSLRSSPLMKTSPSVLSALDQRDARGRTDVFVVSDHGFSTIKRSIDLRRILNDAGFTAKIEELRIAKDGNQSAGGIRDKTEFNDQPKPGDIMLAANGGSVLFYVIGHDKKLTVASLNSCNSRILPV